MTVSFAKRGQIIQARLTDRTVSIRLSTGIKAPEHLNFSKGKFIGNSPEVVALNNELNRQRVKLTDLYQVYRGNAEKIKAHFNPDIVAEPVDTESYDMIELLKQFIKLALKGDIRTKTNRPLSPSTITTYTNALKAIAEFAKMAGSLDLVEMSINPRDEIRKKMDIADKWNRYFREFDDWMIDEGYLISSRSCYLLNIGVMLSHWKNKFFLQLPKIQAHHIDPNPIVVLEPNFVRHFLTDEKTYQSLEGVLKYTWEVCATILITTMRIDDAIKMSISDLHVTKDAMFLSKMNGKTREYTDVPIPKFLEKIYRENLTKNGSIYCMKGRYDIVRSNINKLFKLYPEMHEITTMKKFGAHGEEVTEVGPMYDHVHPHMLRKTAITTMMYYKVSERHIKFCSGHTPNSTAFERYVAFVEKHFKNEVHDYYKQFLGQ